MMPRFSPPTATGLPRNRASAACSTEAKKASASRWTMARESAIDPFFKSEIRRPKSERNPKAEARKNQELLVGFRISSFFRISAFGFRISFALAYQCHHHSLNLQFLLGNEIWIAGIFGAEKWLASLADKCFE